MLDVLVGLVAGLLILAGVLVMLGPNAKSLFRRFVSLRRRRPSLAVFQPSRPRELASPGMNPKTQRVLVAAARLGNWLRARNQEELARELRSAAGRITSDEPAGPEYVPTFPTKPWPIKTRQLLGHLSGVRNYSESDGLSTRFYSSLTEALSIFKDDPLDFEPGTKFSYTVYGYTLLGTVIEGASGMSYIDYMRENVFKPAKMSHTKADNVYDIIPNRARGYGPKVYGQFDGNLRNAALADTSYKIPAGGLVSTVEDLANFAIAVQNGVLIMKETFEQMSRNQKTRDGQETGYGYGWYVGRREGREPDGSVWHGGVQQGFTSDLWILPNKHFAVVILTNLEGVLTTIALYIRAATTPLPPPPQGGGE